MYKISTFMIFPDVIFLIAEGLEAIELGYGDSLCSTNVVENDEYVEIVDEDVAESHVGEKCRSLSGECPS